MKLMTQEQTRESKIVPIGGLPISRLSLEQTVSQIEEWMATDQSYRIATANLDFLRLARERDDLTQCLQGADLITADGAPVVWLSKLMNQPARGRVAGSDLLTPLFESATKNGWSVYFLGGSPGMAEAAAKRATLEHAGLMIAGAEGPRVDLNNQVAMQPIVNRIRESGADIVLVGLGCPKQEFFLEQYLEATGARVGIGVGGSFDFVSQTKKRAPRWMRNVGLEWLYRWSLEPKRLTSRYVKNALLFPRLAMRALREAQPRKTRFFSRS